MSLRAFYGILVQEAEHRTMELLKQLGFNTAPFIYAAAAYGLFYWLDKNASDEAKAALARTMRLKDYKNEQVASALVEVFDRIYTYPLLRWRAFFRSLLFTTVVSAIWLFEVSSLFPADSPDPWWILLFSVSVGLSFNVFTDYLSLFVIKRVLIRSGTQPVISLTLGAVSGVAVVLGAILLRLLLLGEGTFLDNLMELKLSGVRTWFLIVSVPALIVFIADRAG
jgi:hypothetical protein